MKNLLTACLVIITLGFLRSASAQEQKQDFVLVNRTGYELSHIYVAPTKSDEWGDDIMGEAVVPEGTTVKVRFVRGTRGCRWDLKVVYSDDDSSAFWRNIDLCDVDRITIRYDRKSDTSIATFD